MRNMGYRLYFSGSTCLCAQLRIAAGKRGHLYEYVRQLWNHSPMRTAADSSFEVTICDLKNYTNMSNSCGRTPAPMRNCPTAVAALPMRSSAGIICAHRRHLCAFVQQLCLCAIGRIAVKLVVTNLMAKEKGVPMRYAPYLMVSQP